MKLSDYKIIELLGEKYHVIDDTLMIWTVIPYDNPLKHTFFEQKFFSTIDMSVANRIDEYKEITED